jgi:glycosyltransferase involved in cell wall biosynthesis
MVGRVRLYGHQNTSGSFRTVSDGFRRALTAIDELAGVFAIDIDFCDEEADAPGGAMAPVALHTGFPSAIAKSMAHGRHEHRWLMIAPNSDRLPDAMLEWMPKRLTAILTPSEWGKAVIENELCRLDGLVARMKPPPVYVVPHGIDPDVFTPIADAFQSRQRELWERGVFRVLHLTSTNGERKGTRELLQAWRDWVEASPTLQLQLLIISDPIGYLEVVRWVTKLNFAPEQVIVIPNPQLPPERVGDVYNWPHLVCQPSRGEGFGLVPLEALARGVPVALTAATGHCQYLYLSRQGALWHERGITLVRTGASAPLDDLQGSSGPEVTPACILDALVESHRDWLELSDNARDSAAAVAEEWAWEEATGAPLRRILKETLG